MEIQYIMKGNCHSRDWGNALGSYGLYDNIITIHLSRTWEAFPTVDGFMNQFFNSMEHEALHSVIMPIVKDDELNLGRYALARNEYIVHKLMDVELTPLMLAPYIEEDVYIRQLNAVYNDAKITINNLWKKCMLLMIATPIIALLLTFLIDWIISLFKG